MFLYGKPWLRISVPCTAFVRADFWNVLRSVKIDQNCKRVGTAQATGWTVETRQGQTVFFFPKTPRPVLIPT